jgi:hypothetical protein
MGTALSGDDPRNSSTKWKNADAGYQASAHPITEATLPGQLCLIARRLRISVLHLILQIQKAHRDDLFFLFPRHVSLQETD